MSCTRARALTLLPPLCVLLALLPACGGAGAEENEGGLDGGHRDGGDAGGKQDGPSDVHAPDVHDASVDARDGEGGPACSFLAKPGGYGVLDVTAYGAAPDAGDSTAGIQAAINAACADAAMNNGLAPPVFLPMGRFVTTQPLLVTCGIEIVGACRSGSVLAPTFGGPALLLEPPGIALNLVPSLVGTGNAIDTENGDYYLNLRDIPAVELDGLAQFSAEAFIEQTGPYEPGWAAIVGGPDGCEASGAVIPCGSAFRLGVEIQELGAELTVGGTSYSLSGPTVTLDVVHHVAITYDGATIRLFLDGVMVDSQAATGPVNQGVFEDVTVGPTYYPLEASIVADPLPGTIDSVRLSNVARYTTAFTPPTTKLSTDANTLALLNFDTQAPGLTQAQTKDGPFWLPIRRTQDTSGNGLPFTGDQALHDFTVEGGMGIFGWLAVATRVYDVDCIGCDYGFAFLGNNYTGHLEDVSATAGTGRGRFGVYTKTANGNGYHDVTLQGQALPFVTVAGAEQIHTNVTITAGPSTVYALTLQGSDDAFDGLTVDATSAGSAWLGAMGVMQAWAKLQVQRGTIGNAGKGIPITMDGLAGALIEGTSFTGTASAPEILHVPNPVTFPNVVVAATKDSTVPWSDDPDLVLVASDPAKAPDPTTVPPVDPGSSVLLGKVAAAHVFDVVTYGADPTGATSSAVAVQSAVDAACKAGSGNDVFFPVGSYAFERPVLVHCNGLTLEGAGRLASSLRTSTDSPSFVVEAATMTGVDIAPALVGTGSAMKTDGSSYWLELRDATTVELDGLGAFTAEAFVNLTSTTTGYAGIVQSNGCLGTTSPLPGCTSAFTLGTVGGSLSGSVNVGGTSVTLAGPSLSTAVTHHVALTYDGTTARLFLDGALADAAATTGSLAQGSHEDVTLGPMTAGFDATVTNPAVAGVIDSVRLSSTARYSGAFTAPTSKLASDASTLIVVNFDQVAYGATQAIGTSGATVWLPVRRVAEPDGTPEAKLTGLTVRALDIAGLLGVFGMNVIESRYSELFAYGPDYAIVLDGDSSGSTFDSIDILAGGGRGRYGLVTVNGDGNLYHDVSISAADVSLVLAGGSSQLLVHTFVTSNPATSVYGAYFLNAGVTLEGLYFDNESAMPFGMGDIVVASPTAPFVIFKGELDLASPGTPITVDQGQGLVLEGTSFGGSSFAPVLVDLSTASTGTNVAIGVTTQPIASTPLSNDGGVESIGN
jgi:hypothetical protein